MRSYDAGPTDVPIIEEKRRRGIPMTVTGKVRKAEMRTAAIEFLVLNA